MLHGSRLADEHKLQLYQLHMWLKCEVAAGRCADCKLLPDALLAEYAAAWRDMMSVERPGKEWLQALSCVQNNCLMSLAE